MSSKCGNPRKLFLFAFLFLVLCFGVRAQAAGTWKMNSNGTYSYYDEDGKLARSQWIGEDYYVDSNGLRRTGLLYKDGKWYFFTKSGRLIRRTWVKSGGKMHYAGKDGALYVNGRKKVGNYYYAFSKVGVRLTGKRTYSGKTYYFNKTTGRMLTKQWVSSGGKYYYYGKTGALAKDQWVGRYYVDSTGARLTNTWKGDKYLGADGKAVSGIQKIGSVYYYFDPKTYEKVTGTTVTVGGTTYQFASSGKGKIVTSKKAPSTKVSVESTYYSDPYVDDETLLAAIIYCEAGNQPYTGQLAVGAVILNRMNSTLFPDMLREVVYQKTQFSPARDGSLTRALKNPSLVTAQCKKAASAIMSKYETFHTGQKIYLTINGKKTVFSYLFFMTPAAYRRLGLKVSYITIGGHVFFSKWG